MGTKKHRNKNKVPKFEYYLDFINNETHIWDTSTEWDLPEDGEWFEISEEDYEEASNLCRDFINHSCCCSAVSNPPCGYCERWVRHEINVIGPATTPAPKKEEIDPMEEIRRLCK